MGHNKFINKDDLENNNTEISSGQGNHSDYSDHIYVGKGRGEEDLYDRNNPLVRIILLVVGGIALIGTIYYILLAVGTLK